MPDPPPHKHARRRLRELGYWMENKEQVVCDAFEADIPLDVIAAESGLGRSTVYRWHERWRKASQASLQV